MKYVTKSSRPLPRISGAASRSTRPALKAPRPALAASQRPLRLTQSHPIAGAAGNAHELDHTSHKLLDAAERVFADRGYDAASVREITAAAGVNLAAVNYHFGSKAALYDAVFRRILDSLREQRLQAIAQVQERAAAEGDLEMLLHAFATAFLAPLMDPNRGHQMMQLFMRELTSPNLPPRLVVDQLVEPIQRAMSAALVTVSPGLSQRAASFCLHSIVGQLVHVLQVWRMGTAGQISMDSEALIRQALAHIVEFSAAGVRVKAGAAKAG